ncbi:MAG: cytochrome P450 [Deltaproteobacteria bacterium]|nr:cytochrome P450 [Deltaproteobacteria bacterium]
MEAIQETAAAAPKAEPSTRRVPPGPPTRGASVFSRIRYGLNFFFDPFGFVGGRFESYGDTYFVAAENQPGLYVFRKPEDVWAVLVTEAKKFRKTHSAFRELGQVLGESGLLTTDGDTWRKHRRIVQPAFSPKRMSEYAEVMIEETVREARSWEHGKRIDLADAMMELTLRIVARTLFGHDASGDVDAVRDAMRTLQDGLVGAQLPIPRWMNIGLQRQERAVATLDALIARMIETRRRQGGNGQVDLLQRLLDARDPETGAELTDTEIRDHLVTFFLAGHETTSNALTWTFHLLGENPAQRARLEAHLDEVLGDRDPTPEDFPNLGFATQVLEEGMRLRPPVFVMARQAAEAVTIGEWELPAGSEVVLWLWHTHHDSRIYPDPERFDPDRFAPDAKAALPKGAYLPFGQGPRTCIGKHFALMEGTLLLATIARRWRLEPTGAAPKLHARVTLSPKNGLPMIPKKR